MKSSRNLFVDLMARISFFAINGVKSLAGDYLRYVMNPPEYNEVMKKSNKIESIDLDEYYNSGTEDSKSEDSEDDKEERFEELEDQVERMDIALARIEQEMKENRSQMSGQYPQDRNSFHRHRSNQRSRSPARRPSAEHHWC